jgi:hypothetical protein
MSVWTLSLEIPKGAQAKALHTVSQYSLDKKCSDLFKNNKPCHAGLVTTDDLRILSTNITPNFPYEEFKSIIEPYDRDRGLEQ